MGRGRGEMNIMMRHFHLRGAAGIDAVRILDGGVWVGGVRDLLGVGFGSGGVPPGIGEIRGQGDKGPGCGIGEGSGRDRERGSMDTFGDYPLTPEYRRSPPNRIG